MSDSINIFNQPNLHVLIGRSRSGKSYLIKYLISQCLENKIFKFGIVICPSKFNGDYNFLPDKYVYEGNTEIILEKYLTFITTKYKDKIPNNFIIFDDCLGNLHDKSELFISFISRYRHFKCSVFITSQYTNLLSTLIRQQMSYCWIIGHVQNELSYKALYNCCGQICNNYNDCVETIDNITSVQYQAMVYDAYNSMFYKFIAPTFETKTFKY